MYEDSSNLAIALQFYGVCEFFPGDCASSWSNLFLTNGKSCTSKNVM
jgi:hypothetical protein